MPKPRDYSLPTGMSDLGDKIRADDAARRQQTEEDNQQIRQLRLVFEKGDWITTPDLLDLLCQRIDHDLLFTENFELVERKIHEVVAEEWNRVFNRLRMVASERVKQRIIEASIRGVWQLICHLRQSHLGWPPRREPLA
jgi:hypothetical protein